MLAGLAALCAAWSREAGRVRFVCGVRASQAAWPGLIGKCRTGGGD